MAKQRGVLPLSGTVGGVSYRKTQDGYIAQQKSSLTKERVKTDPAFEGSRGSSHEFGTGSHGASLLQRLFQEGTRNCRDNRVHSRLTSKVRRAIEADPVSKKGERNLLNADIITLRGFWWNKHIDISNALGTRFSVEVDREAGEVRFSIGGFVPEESLKVNPRATHYRIIASTAEVDWVEGRMGSIAETGYMKRDNKKTEPLNLVIPVKKGSTVPIISCLAICWYQQVAGEMNVLRDMTFNTAGIVDVNVGEGEV